MSTQNQHNDLYKSLAQDSGPNSLELQAVTVGSGPNKDDEQASESDERNGNELNDNISRSSKNNGYPQVAKIGDAIIRLRNIHKTYLLGLEGVPALRGVSLTIHKGEFIVILGKSGGGKTSMLNIMGTIDKPTKGDLYIEGKRISSATTDSEVAHIRLKKIGFCFQTFNLISSMTALENVELPLILDGTLSSSAIKKRSKKLLDHMGLGDRYNHLPSQLSGGEQQRVTIARAIANNPSVLLLDEPTGDLDTKNSNIVMDVLLRLNRLEGITCVFVTHDVGLKYFAHRVIHMLDGKISRVENISSSKRKQIERELKNSLNVGKAEVTIEKTEVRQPSKFYSYHRWLKENTSETNYRKIISQSSMHSLHSIPSNGNNNNNNNNNDSKDKENDQLLVEEHSNNDSNSLKNSKSPDLGRKKEDDSSNSGNSGNVNGDETGTDNVINDRNDNDKENQSPIPIQVTNE